MTLWYSFAAELFGSSEPGSSACPCSGPHGRCGSISILRCSSRSSQASGCGSRRIPGRTGRSLGSALILFATYFQVQVSVAINSWFGPFYDLIQAALSKTRAGDAVGVLRRHLDLRLDRSGRGRGRRADALLRQPLHLPLAHRDERILHRQLAAAAQDRRRLAACAGRHHAVCHHHRTARRQSHQCRPDADRLPAGAGQAFQQCHRTAAGRLPSPIRWSSRRWSGRYSEPACWR